MNAAQQIIMVGSALGGARGGTPSRTPTYYFSTAGSDANDGRTIGAPKQTITAFNALTLVATDYVAFRTGDTFSGNMVIPAGGSALSTVIIGSYGILSNPIISAASNTSGITATNLSYLTLQNLMVTGAGGTSGDGILFTNSSGNANNLTISGCTASGFAGNGIKIIASGGTITNPKILNCIASANTVGAQAATAGIMLRGVFGAQVSGVYGIINGLISGCSASGNTGVAGFGNWSGSGIFIANAQDSVVTGCVADNNGAVSNNAAGPSGIWMSDCKNVWIRRSEAKNTKSAGGDGGGFDIDGGCVNCGVEFCYAHDNVGYGLMNYMFSDGGVHITSNTNNTIRFNVSARDKLGGLRAVPGGTEQNTGQMYGNVVYINGTGAVGLKLEFSGGLLQQVIANNVFVTQSLASTLNLIATTGTPANITLVGNDYFAYNTFQMNWNGTNYSTYAAWQAATGLEKIAGNNVGFNTDPLFIGNPPTTTSADMFGFRLQAASPLVNAGVNIFTNYGLDPGPADYFGGVLSTSGPWSVGINWVLPPAPSQWTPAAIYGLEFYWDTTNALSAVDDGSGKVQFLKDVYNPAKIIAQATSGARPAISTVGGPSANKRVMSFGSGTYLSSADAGAANFTEVIKSALYSSAKIGKMYACYAAKENAISTVNRILGFYASDSSSYLQARFTATGKGAAILGTGGSQEMGDQAVQDTSWHVHEFVKNDVSLIYTIDGVQVGTVTITQTGSTNVTQFLIGAVNVASVITAGFVGGMGPGIIVAALPSSSDQSSARQLIGGLMGITTS